MHYFTLKLDTIWDGNNKNGNNFQLAREKCQKCDDDDDDDGKQKQKLQKLHKIQFRIRNSNQLLRFEFNVFYLLYANDAVFSFVVAAAVVVIIIAVVAIVVVHSL